MLSHRIDPVAGIVYVEGEQGRGVAEFATMLRAVVADPAYRPGFGFLRDRRGMPALETPLLRRNVTALRNFFGTTTSRWAFVVTDPANYGMARMTASLVAGSPSEVAIFDDLEAAVRWLSERAAPGAAQPKPGKPPAGAT